MCLVDAAALFLIIFFSHALDNTACLSDHQFLLNFWVQARPAVISILKMVDLSGKDGVVSEFSPGVFLQVYLFAFVLSYFGI